MIKAEKVSKIYYQGKTEIGAVRDADISIKKEESVIITGPSGAGKSTLLHLLGGLDKPDSGKVLFDGKDFYALSDRERSAVRNERAGFVFQLYHLLPEFTALENVMLPALIGGGSKFRRKKDIKKRALEILDRVGLSDRAKHRPAELSGGESQRAAIARALINFPEVLFCDEPTGNLDSRRGKEIIEYIWALKKSEKMALVIVTHDEKFENRFDKRFKIKDGILELSAESQ